MTKAELIAELGASYPHLRPTDAELIVTAVFEHIAQALTSGHRVGLRGFGTFITKQRDARTGRNPRNGEEVSVSAKAFPFFKPGRGLRARVNRPVR